MLVSWPCLGSNRRDGLRTQRRRGVSEEEERRRSGEHMASSFAKLRPLNRVYEFAESTKVSLNTIYWHTATPLSLSLSVDLSFLWGEVSVIAPFFPWWWEEEEESDSICFIESKQKLPSLLVGSTLFLSSIYTVYSIYKGNWILTPDLCFLLVVSSKCK